MHEMANPVLCEIHRDGHRESIHRGAWVLTNVDGVVLDGRGDYESPVFARSSTKSLQALPFLESGAAARVTATPEDIAVAISSHDAEPLHLEQVASLLRRAGLSPEDLRCGAEQPRWGSPSDATRIANGCSGKHAAFLVTALHLGDHSDEYLSALSAVQRQVRAAVHEMTDTPVQHLGEAIDGCSAPTFRLPLRNLATGLARVATPVGLPDHRRRACEQMCAAARAHPKLVGGSRGRFDTDLLRATDGRVFPKVGAEGIHTLGIRGSGLGLAVKIDDGSRRGLHRLVIEILHRIDQLDDASLEALVRWRDARLRNVDDLVVGHVHTPEPALPETT